jgi:hypothetical protein
MRSSITGSVENLKLARKRAGEEPSAHVPVKSGDPAFDRMLTNGFQKLISEVSGKRQKGSHGDMININQSNNKDNVASLNSKSLYYTNSSVFGGHSTEERIKIDKLDTNSNASYRLLPSSITPADDCKTIESSSEGFLPSSNASDDADPDAMFEYSDDADPDTMFEHLFHEPDELAVLNMYEKKFSSQNHQLVSGTNTVQRNNNPLFSPPDKRSIIGPWYCPLCTYYNTSRNWVNASCEMCEQGQRSLAPK